MSGSPPPKDAADIRAAAALFAIEEVGDLLERLDKAKVDLTSHIRSETRSAVLEGMRNLEQQQDQSIHNALGRLKIRTRLLEPRHYSLQWLASTATIGLLIGILIGLVIGEYF